jgi:hypothetical protein
MPRGYPGINAGTERGIEVEFLDTAVASCGADSGESEFRDVLVREAPEWMQAHAGDVDWRIAHDVCPRGS